MIDKHTYKCNDFQRLTCKHFSSTMFNYVLPIFNHLANSIAFVTHNPLHNYYNRCKNKLPEESFPFRQPKLVVISYRICPIRTCSHNGNGIFCVIFINYRGFIGRAYANLRALAHNGMCRFVFIIGDNSNIDRSWISHFVCNSSNLIKPIVVTI